MEEKLSRFLLKYIITPHCHTTETKFLQKTLLAEIKMTPGLIQHATGPVSYQIRLEDGRVVRHHVDNVRLRSIVV